MATSFMRMPEALRLQNSCPDC